MTPEGARASYLRFLNDRVTVTRNAAGTTTVTATATKIPARVMGYSPNEKSGDVMQGDRQVIILVDALVAQDFPLPLLRGDVLTLSDGRTLKIQTVDADTRKVDQTLIAYDCRARGS